MFDHELNPVKGWPSPYAVDASGAFATAWQYAGTTATELYGGGVVSYDTTAGGWVPGCDADKVPIFLLQNNYDFDVSSDTGATNGGFASGLPGIACYEIETTEYYASGSYSIGTWLTAYTYADRATSTLANAGATGKCGKVVNGVFDKSDLAAAYCANIVGVVTATPRTNEHGKSVLKVYTHYIPHSILPA